MTRDSTLRALIRRSPGLHKAVRRTLQYGQRIRYGTGPVRVGALRYELPPSEAGLTPLLRSGAYEDAERRILNDILRPGMNVLEIGGCLGVLSCEVAARIGDGRLVVVEPVPDSAAAIERNLALNGLSATVLRQAIAYGADEVTIRDGSCALGHSLYRDGGCGDDGWRVPASTVRELIERLDFVPDVLVMDAEGAEYDFAAHDLPALAGLGVTVVAEVHPTLFPEDRTAAFVHDVLKAGYRLDRLHVGDERTMHALLHPIAPELF